jgi:deoxyribonuclease IV
LRLGIHTSISGSLEQSALKAYELGANTFQIFSASPRMWRAGMPRVADIQRLRQARERLDLHPLAIHANYLVNLASLDPVVRARSIQSFRGELERAVAIGAEFLVVHPGSYRGNSIEQSIAAFALALRDAAHGLRTGRLTVLLENTAGAGNHLGSRFEELQSIRDLARDLTGLAVGYCLDTCHLLAAGFPIATPAGLRSMLASAEEALGLSNIYLIHANDSRGALGSRIDRHANIGEGHIGSDGFRRILAHPKLRTKPFILETPVKQPGDDRRNLDTLKALRAHARTSARRVIAS